MSLILWGKEEKGKKGMCLNHSPCGGSFRVWRVPQGQCRHTHRVVLLRVSFDFWTHFLRVKLQLSRLGGFRHINLEYSCAQDYMCLN